MNSEKIQNDLYIPKEKNIWKKLIRNMLWVLRNIETKNNKIDTIINF